MVEVETDEEREILKWSFHADRGSALLGWPDSHPLSDKRRGWTEPLNLARLKRLSQDQLPLSGAETIHTPRRAEMAHGLSSEGADLVSRINGGKALPKEHLPQIPSDHVPILGFCSYTELRPSPEETVPGILPRLEYGLTRDVNLMMLTADGSIHSIPPHTEDGLAELTLRWRAIAGVFGLGSEEVQRHTHSWSEPGEHGFEIRHVYTFFTVPISKAEQAVCEGRIFLVLDETESIDLHISNYEQRTVYPREKRIQHASWEFDPSAISVQWLGAEGGGLRFKTNNGIEVIDRRQGARLKILAWLKTLPFPKTVEQKISFSEMIRMAQGRTEFHKEKFFQAMSAFEPWTQKGGFPFEEIFRGATIERRVRVTNFRSNNRHQRLPKYLPDLRYILIS
jgi:hypothetical protein